ncbi:hypothetical protein SD78_1472 [Bacillus badius]|nr:hypothetical protein SD78_1472 [Bacillus badius]
MAQQSKQTDFSRSLYNFARDLLSIKESKATSHKVGWKYKREEGTTLLIFSSIF